MDVLGDTVTRQTSELQLQSQQLLSHESNLTELKQNVQDTQIKVHPRACRVLFPALSMYILFLHQFPLPSLQLESSIDSLDTRLNEQQRLIAQQEEHLHVCVQYYYM